MPNFKKDPTGFRMKNTELATSMKYKTPMQKNYGKGMPLTEGGKKSIMASDANPGFKAAIAKADVDASGTKYASPTKQAGVTDEMHTEQQKVIKKRKERIDAAKKGRKEHREKFGKTHQDIQLHKHKKNLENKLKTTTDSIATVNTRATSAASQKSADKVTKSSATPYRNEKKKEEEVKTTRTKDTVTKTKGGKSSTYKKTKTKNNRDGSKTHTFTNDLGNTIVETHSSKARK